MPASDDEDGDSKQEQDSSSDSSGRVEASRIDIKDAVLVALSAAVAVVAVFFFPLGLDNISSLDFGPLLSPSSLLIAFIALPVAYAASISLDGFKKESLFAFLVLPAFAAEGKIAVAAVAVPISTLYASYRSRSIYNGRNKRWTLYRSGGAIVLSFAVATGIGLAYTATSDTGFTADLQNATTEEVVSQTSDIAGESVTGIQQQQKEQAMRLAKSLGMSAATMAIEETEKDVVQRMERSGSFSSSQQQVILQAFATAKTNVPIQVANNLTRTVENRFNQTEIADGEIGGISGTVESTASSVTDPIFQNRKIVAVGLFMASLSFLYMLKIPFQLLTLLFGSLLLLLPD